MKTLYVTGLLDEREFDNGDRQAPDEHGIPAYGPFDSLEAAQKHARALSIDPDEGVVLELTPPLGKTTEYVVDVSAFDNDATVRISAASEAEAIEKAMKKYDISITIRPRGGL